MAKIIVTDDDGNVIETFDAVELHYRKGTFVVFSEKLRAAVRRAS